ncbi:MAG: hypothetical protein O6947_07880, partial [Acidobacteria bacterium]|nr:hypothetical protein [Acidobacteriota bacterium]
TGPFVLCSNPVNPRHDRTEVIISRPSGIVLVVLVLAMNTGCAELLFTKTAPPESLRSVELLPGVLIDTVGSTAYLMNPKGGIDAVDLSTGRLLWTSHQGAKPILVHRNLLATQAEIPDRPGALRIAVLDTRNAGKVVATADVELPAGARAFIDQRMGESFEIQSRIDREDLILSWKFFRRPVEGAAPGSSAKPGHDQAGGAFRIDLRTGEAKSLGSGEVPPRDLLPERVARKAGSGTLSTPPLPAGKVFAAAEVRTRNGRQQTILRRWERKTGNPIPDITLFDGRARALLPSANGLHLLAIRMNHPGGGDGGKYLWSIYSLETGILAGEIRNRSSASRFLLLGSILIHESPPFRQLVEGKWLEKPIRVRVVDLDTGTELWERPIRDTVFHRPYPPRG